jgi:EmrB/QacA subfamily drug resistance transporter
MIPVGLGIFLATLDSSIVNIALPVLERDFHTHFSLVEWVVLAYLMTVTCLMLSIGRLADMVGKKPLYVTGLIIFTAGSVLCGLCPTITLLIACRVIQGLGAALLMALSAAIITEAFPARQRGRALGVTGLAVSLGIITGPTLGGLLLGSLSWHWIFFVNLPLGILATVMAVRQIPNTPGPGAQHFDLPGAACLCLCLMCLTLGLTWGQHSGFLRGPVLTLLGGTAVTLGLFVGIESKTAQPMVDLSLFRHVLFRVNLITGFLAFVCSAGLFIMIPFYLQNVRGYSPQKAGLLMAIVPLSVGLVAPKAGALSDRFGTRPLTALGLALQLTGYIGVYTLGLQTSVIGYVLRFIPIGIGIGCFQSPNNSAIMGAVPRERLGVASGLLSITRTLGQVVGIAVLGAVWAARQRIHSESASAQAPLPQSIQVTALHETLIVIMAIITVALILSLWAWYQGGRSADRQCTH